MAKVRKKRLLSQTFPIKYCSFHILSLSLHPNYSLKPKIDMETTRKRTREGVRAAFMDFMREREEERKAAQLRHSLNHPERL